MRNQIGLTTDQIEKCTLAWRLLCSESNQPHPRQLIVRVLSRIIGWRGQQQNLLRIDFTEASGNCSRTRYNEKHGVLYIGADAYPGAGVYANSRMSLLGCLAHELAHIERHRMGFERPFDEPEKHLDEAETSIHASFMSVLSSKDREDLVEDARERIGEWMKIKGTNI